MEKEKKWTLNIGAEYANEEISPEIKLKDKIDDFSTLEIKCSKDKIYAEYELKF